MIRIKWVYKTKLNDNGEIDKYKVWLVVKGYKQEFRVNYREGFSPIVRLDTRKLVIALATQNSQPICQLDVKSTYLHGDLQEQVFIEQLSGYVMIDEEHTTFLYGDFREQLFIEQSSRYVRLMKSIKFTD